MITIDDSAEVGPAVPETETYPEVSSNRYFKATLNCDKGSYFLKPCLLLLDEYKALICIQPCYPQVAPVILLYSPSALPPHSSADKLFKSNFGLFSDDSEPTTDSMQVEEQDESVSALRGPVPKVTGLLSRAHKGKIVPPALLPYLATSEYPCLAPSVTK